MSCMIIKLIGGRYDVFDGNKVIACKPRGVFRNQSIKPVVGDFVELEYINEKEATIVKVLPRFNQLVRPPLANIDLFLLVMSATEPSFSHYLVDKFLLLVEASHIRPVIVVTKLDLVKDKETFLKSLEGYKNDGYDVVVIDPIDDAPLQHLKALFKDKLVAISGQTGVGKSTLLNRLDPTLTQKTNGISKALGRGKHTTRHSECFRVADGWVADTPGFSLLELTMDPIVMAHAYEDFESASKQCKFRGCLHLSEPECAVKQRVMQGEISQRRYDHYVLFQEEVRKGNRR